MHQRVTNKFVVRVVLPIALILLVLCGVLFFFLHRSAEDFANEQLRMHIDYQQKEIHNIISMAYSSIPPAEKDDDSFVLVKKAETISRIDIYFKTYGLAGSVTQNGELLYSFYDPAKEWQSPDHLAAVPAQFSSVVLFPQWDWKVVTVQDPTTFKVFTGRVTSTVVALLALFLVMSAAVLLLLWLSVKKPIESIIRNIKKNTPPDYRGVAEFEFLSNTIAADMQRREEYERILVQSKGELEVLVQQRTEQLQVEVDERRQTAEQLFAEKERLAVTLHSISDGVITTDTSGAVVLLNKAAEEFTGIAMNEAVGRPVAEVFALYCEESGDPCGNKVLKVLATGDAIGYTPGAVLTGKDGTVRNIADSCAPIRDRNNKMVGVVVAIRDISEVKKLEDERFKTKNLESIGFLAGGIAHDFNNLLTIISGNIDLAAESSLEPVSQRQLLAEAAKATERAAGLTQQLLTFARGGAPVRKTAHLEDIIRDSAGFILRGSKSDYSFTVDRDLWPVKIDKGQISQVIQNLVLNASQAMPGGGTVEIICRNEDCAGSAGTPLPEDKCVRIEVRDSGIGIPAEHLDKIFDPYFTSREMGEQKGTGLGLSIVHSVVNKHGGTIQVQSQPGAGTTFTIHLAAQIEDVTEHGGRGEDPVNGQGVVMVMDDDRMVRELIRQMLVRLGYGVVLTRDGAEAIQRYQEMKESGKAVDAVIMDLTVPGGMGGDEAAARLLAIDPQARIIVSSGYSNAPVMADFQQYGFAGAVEKPFKLAGLSKVVSDVLR